MHKSRHFLLVAACVFAFVGVFVLPGASQVSRPEAPVVVKNTPEEPVPTTVVGDVTIGGEVDIGNLPLEVSVQVRVTPSPEDIRSFSGLVNDETGTVTFIQNPGEQPGFVVTDLVLEGLGVDPRLTVRLSSGPNELGVFMIPLDSSGFGRRELTFKSGLVATTNPGSLYLSKVGGSGTVRAVLSGYYFTPSQ